MNRFFINNVDEFKNEKVNNILVTLFLLSIILIPFDNIPYLSSILGELGVRAPVYIFIPITIIVIIYFLLNKKIYINLTVEKKVLCIFLGWTVISSLININTIMESSFKERSGINKLLLQIMVLGFMVLIMYLTNFIICLKDIKLETIRKYVTISAIIVIIYATIEILHIYGVLNLEFIITKVSSVIQTFNRGFLYGDRVRSVTGEASFLGMYIAFAFPWVVSYIFTESKKSKKIGYALISSFIIFIVYASKSRTAYAIIMGEIGLVLFGFLLFSKSKSKKITAMIFTIICIISIGSFDKLSNGLRNFGAFLNSNVENNQEEKKDDGYDFQMSVGGVVESLASKTSHSNIARLGLQKSALRIGNDNPILGVGLGQFGFYADRYLTDDTRVSYEIQRWTNPEEVDYWPPAFSIYPRIVAEQGYVGIVIWAVLLLVVSLRLLKIILTSEKNSLEILMLVSFAGVVVSQLNADTYALPQLWILLGIIISYNDKKLKKI